MPCYHPPNKYICLTVFCSLLITIFGMSNSVRALPLEAEQLNNQSEQVEESYNRGQIRTLLQTCFLLARGCGGASPGGAALLAPNYTYTTTSSTSNTRRMWC